MALSAPLGLVIIWLKCYCLGAKKSTGCTGSKSKACDRVAFGQWPVLGDVLSAESCGECAHVALRRRMCFGDCTLRSFEGVVDDGSLLQHFLPLNPANLRVA